MPYKKMEAKGNKVMRQKGGKATHGEVQRKVLGGSRRRNEIFLAHKQKKKKLYGNEGNKSPPTQAKYSLTGFQEEEEETKDTD